MKNWLDNWCRTHPGTTVVRFTSLFYNFAWIWGEDAEKRNCFTDWGSYDFTVSPRALNRFYEQYGYALTAEDFVNKGNYQVTHMPASFAKKQWMKFIASTVAQFAAELVEIVHKYNKKAYVFYDDSWIGLEPYGKYYPEIGFDGIIKCVFSAYEVRLCAGVNTPVHEVRLHPYLFPVGLGGKPTFSENGNPTADARKYWMNVRRAMLRVPVQRIGLGGYLHLTESYPDFQDYIEKIADEFRMIKECHSNGKPYTLGVNVAVIHHWGRLRSWTLSGHFHETYMHDLIHVIEALAGFPLQVDFISFEDVKSGKLDGYHVIINAGKAGDAWSGGDAWADSCIVEQITRWAYSGGTFIGIGEPSAVRGFNTYFRLAEVLGVDKDNGEKVCHGKWPGKDTVIRGLLPDGYTVEKEPGIYIYDKDTLVLRRREHTPVLTLHSFGAGRGIYLGGFSYTCENARLLLNLLLYPANASEKYYISDNCNVDCAFYPDSGKLVIANSSDELQKTSVYTEAGRISYEIEPYGLKMFLMNNN